MTTNESRWPASPLYLAGLDALREVVPDADPTPLALEYTRTGREMADWPDWPHPDPIVRLRFQMRWTANVQARCGLDPMEPETPAALVEKALRRGERPEAIAATVGMHPDYVRAMGRTLGVVADRSRAARDANAVRWADPAQRARQAEVARTVAARRGGSAHAA